MKISVVIPTYCRPQDLERCLKGLKKQHRMPDEVIVVIRNTDIATQDFVEFYRDNSLPINTVTVEIPGQIAALNAGLGRAKGDIISITDDDAVPRPQWLSRIETHFLSDPNIGGVGGRDWVYSEEAKLLDGEARKVGCVQWFGRRIGNHHLGVGNPREVEFLKGANMSYRKAAITNMHFDERLRGSGAQVHNDLAFSLNVKRLGWKLIYDPMVEIDHYHGKRFDEDLRNQFNETAWLNAVHNETLASLDYFPFLKRFVYLIWVMLIGHQKSWGLLQLLRFLPREGKLAVKKWQTSLNGQWLGWQTWQQK